MRKIRRYGNKKRGDLSKGVAASGSVPIKGILTDCTDLTVDMQHVQDPYAVPKIFITAVIKYHLLNLLSMRYNHSALRNNITQH